MGYDLRIVERRSASATPRLRTAKENLDMARSLQGDGSFSALPLEQIREVCRRHGVQEMALFGSALRDDFHAASDLDFLVRFRPDAAKPWMSHFQELQEDLSRLLGRDVDLADWNGVEASRNWIRRRSILESARLLYAA